MEYLIVALLVVNVALTGLILLIRARTSVIAVPDGIHDHSAHDAGVLSELRDIARPGMGRLNLHDVETVMRQHRERRNPRA